MNFIEACFGRKLSWNVPANTTIKKTKNKTCQMFTNGIDWFSKCRRYALLRFQIHRILKFQDSHQLRMRKIIKKQTIKNEARTEKRNYFC